MYDGMMDECDIAAELEQHERDYSIYQILKNKPSARNMEALLDINLECELCSDIIPIERQKIILTIHHTCNYCVECQMIIDKENKLFGN
jgi:hypothetical protein